MPVFAVAFCQTSSRRVSFCPLRHRMVDIRRWWVFILGYAFATTFLIRNTNIYKSHRRSDSGIGPTGAYSHSTQQTFELHVHLLVPLGL